MGDEIIYSENAKSVADGGGLDIRGEPSSLRTLYPVLVAPAWVAESIETAFAVAKGINTVLMTIAAVPLYFWARRLVSPEWALAAAGLLLLMPAFAYTGTIMTENAFLPIFIFALFAFARALETPTPAWQLVALGAALVSVAIRLQGLVLVAVLVTAILLDALGVAWGARPRGRAFVARLRAFTPIAATLALLAVAYLTYALVASGSAVSSGLGTYDAVTEVGRYSLSDGVRWTAFHAGELAFSVGLLPMCAFGILACAWLRPSALPAERAFVSVTSAALIWLVPQAGFFASRFSGRIEERNLFYVAPLLLLALVAWAACGAPRTMRATAVAVAVPVALMSTIPLERLFNVSLLSDTFALIPLLRLSGVLEGGTDAARFLFGLGAVAAVLLFVLVPPRLAFVTVGAVALFLALSAWSVAGTLRDQANLTRLEAGSANVSWIDDAIGTDADAPFVFTADLVANPHPLWQTEFWNRSVGDVYGLDVVDPTGLPTVRTTIDARGRFVSVDDGRRPLSPRYVVAQPVVGIAGEKIASTDRLVLYRIRGPLRIDQRVDGVFADGWSGANATYTNFSTRPGTVNVDVGRAGWTGPDTPGAVRIDVERIDSGRRVSTATWVIHSGAKRTFRLKTPAAPFRVKLSVQPTFSPATHGFSDTRQLGAQVAFAFEPRSQAVG
jgi:hypothetical protein